MNPRVLRRFIILMVALTVGMFLSWDLLKSYVTQPAGDFDTKMGDQRLMRVPELDEKQRMYKP